MRQFTILAVLLLVTALWASVVTAQDQPRDRLAQTGMKFLSVSVHPRAAAMADAVTAREASSVAMFYNPAGMALMAPGLDVALGRTEWLAGTSYNMASAAYRAGVYGVFGFSVVSVDYGDYFLGTIRADNEKGYIDLGQFAPSALSAGLGYARSLSDRFAVGANVKYVRQSLGESTMSVGADGPERQAFSKATMAIDFGVLYQTGFRSLTFAFGARNFSSELTYAEENFELPLSFRMGVSVDAVDFTRLDPQVHALRIGLDAERPRDYAEQVKIGGEYEFMHTLALRAGYVFPTDEQGVNLGAGLKTHLDRVRLGIDYAYTQFGAFGNVNRLAVQFGF